MASTSLYDVVVVGAGVEGSAAAYDLSRRGCRVLLLEQFPLPHSRGSSHGQTRVTRKAYPEAIYTAMMRYCTEEWEKLQSLSGVSIYKQIGYLAIGEHKGKFLDFNISSMKKHGETYEELSPDEFQKVYPMLRYGHNIGGVYDPAGGILMADKAVQAMQKFFIQNGGVLKDGEKVTEITPGEVIKIKTSKGNYQCKSVVLTCGPWTNNVLDLVNLRLPLQPIKINVCYWPETDVDSHSASKLPTFFDLECCGGHSIYGLPSEEYPGHVKLCLHYGPEIDPESRDSPNSQWTIDLLKDYVATHFPGLKPSPSIIETCIYTNTPDKNLILDYHPKWKNIVVGAGFSGHGFKLAPAVGQILSDMALGKSPQFDVTSFKMSRFLSKL